MNKKVLWITQTAICTTLLVVSQVFTSTFHNTLVTGSLVNLILIVTAIICGMSSGIAVACVSPVFAKLIGIGPFWTLIPFIMLGNVTLVFIWNSFGRKRKNKYGNYIVGWVLGAVVKFAVLYLGIVKFAIPIILKLPEQKAAVMSVAFSLPQLFTALIGGGIAIIILPILKRAVR